MVETLQLLNIDISTLILQIACVYHADSFHLLNEAYEDKAWTELYQI